MSDDSQLTCPECQTTQSSSAPFCENCGYRIRRTDTVKEGHQAITAEVLRNLAEDEANAAAPHNNPTRTDPSRSNQPSDPSQVPTSPEREKVGDSAPSSPSAGPAQPPDDGGPRTYVEGLEAIESTEASDEPPPASRSAERPTSPSQSAIIERPAPDAKSGRLALYMAIWLSITAVAVLATYFLATHAASQDGTDNPPPEVPDTVEIASGPFLRGLEGDMRSFILQMCKKVEDDPDETCKQEKLLKGEYPEKTVELDTFEIDSTEVAVGEYEACVDDGACEPIDYKKCAVWTHQGLQISLRVPKALQEAQMPVTCATLAQANAYCEFAGGALPSSDQWEKAGRGTKGELFPWGTSWSSDIANWGEMDIAQNPIVGRLDGFEWTAPPASFPDGKSPFGVYDMAGNVAEWVDTGEELKAAARGGSWTSHPFDLRSTHRLQLEPDERRTDVGFRCVYQ